MKHPDGISLAGFAKKHDLKPNTFLGWFRKYKMRPDAPAPDKNKMFSENELIIFRKKLKKEFSIKKSKA